MCLVFFSDHNIAGIYHYRSVARNQKRPVGTFGVRQYGHHRHGSNVSDGVVGSRTVRIKFFIDEKRRIRSIVIIIDPSNRRLMS